MLAWIKSADDILRRAPWVMHDANSRRTLLRMLAWLVLCGLFYGAVMGTFRALASQPQWLRQIVYSALKVPLLLTVTFVISLPSFFVVNTLVGLRSDFVRSVRALIAAQAGLAIVLASLTPFTVFWYTTSAVHREALLCNAVMFAVASFSAQWLLRGYYRPLIDRNPRHATVLWCWLVVYSTAAIQLAWLMRPFIGAPGQKVVFLRPEAWDNAYVILLRMIWRTLFG
jgi:hypothetical protein